MHKDDQMTPNQRIAAFLKGESIDRVPIMPMLVTVSGKVAGMTHRQKRGTAAAQAEAQIACYRRFGNDLLLMEYGLHGMGIALGSRTNDPEDAVPAVVDYVLKDLDDVETLDMSRVELANDPGLRLNVESAKIALDRVGDEVGVGILISGPFTAAASVHQTEHLLRATRRKPEQLHRLVRLCTEGLKSVCREFIRAGALIALCDPIASGTILRLEQYREFALPYTIELMKEIHDAGGMVCYHICGDTGKMLRDMATSGCDMLSVDNRVDLGLTREQVGGGVCIVGNVDPVGVLMMGTPDDVESAVKSCFAKAWNSPCGYVLASGCDVPIDVPVENLDRMMEAGRKYGRWPLDGARYA